MPFAAKHQCGQVGCRALTDGRFCREHQQQPAGEPSHGWDTDRRPVVRVRGRKLQALRRALFAREPWCRACRVRRATIRDHVVPLAEGGADDESNEQPLCQGCSDVKTHAESRRGQIREAPSRAR